MVVVTQHKTKLRDRMLAAKQNKIVKMDHKPNKLLKPRGTTGQPDCPETHDCYAAIKKTQKMKCEK